MKAVIDVGTGYKLIRWDFRMLVRADNDLIIWHSWGPPGPSFSFSADFKIPWQLHSVFVTPAWFVLGNYSCYIRPSLDCYNCAAGLALMNSYIRIEDTELGIIRINAAQSESAWNSA
ncbi:hypothetical protein V6Z77_002363 [Aspergillus fumigatus]